MTPMCKRFVGALLLALSCAAAAAGGPAVTVQVDVTRNRHPIDPRVYGLAYADTAALRDLNVPLNRMGGNPTSRYNWSLNADNRGADWYFESIGYDSAVPGEHGDTFVAASKQAGAQAMLTIPMTDWIAKLGPNRAPLASFSIKKYGPQADHDAGGFPDAGSGISANGTPITGNDPNDANVPNSPEFESGWVKHLVDRWGTADSGGLRYYLLDNEASIWFAAHRDVEPTGIKMDEYLQRAIAYAQMIKGIDPSAVVVGPEEWGWSGYVLSGYDQQWGNEHGWLNLPDQTAHGGMEYLPWLLDQLHKNDQATGKRLLDVFSVHYYPQGGEFSDDTSKEMQLLRNRSTRALWDPNYVEESWINEEVQLLPRIKNWVATYYPGTQTGLTEYNWGAEGHINGATAQADILGILGREGVDMAARWTTPLASTPTYKAIKLYRNYDGNGSGFGDVSVLATVPNPDELAAFAAERSSDGALTVMVINKALTGQASVGLDITGFQGAGPAQAWQLTSANAIKRLADVPLAGSGLSTSVPAQSITLFVVGKASAPAQPAYSATASVTPSTVAPGGTVLITSSFTVNGQTFSGIADIEVYGPAGARVAQQFWEGQSFSAGQTRTYTYQWTAPAQDGTYTVDLGLFTPGWADNPFWQNAAATVTVRAGAGGGPAPRGDVNGDGSVTVADAALALAIAVGVRQPTAAQLQAADLDGNGSVSVGEVALILRAAIGASPLP